MSCCKAHLSSSSTHHFSSFSSPSFPNPSTSVLFSSPPIRSPTATLPPPFRPPKRRLSPTMYKRISVRANSTASTEEMGLKLGKRTDLKKIMILGAGPIVIGQACEFDYSGTQACKALREEGYDVVLINSNPATIMTDPDLADRTYITPMTPELVEQVLEKERPDALLPTMGGQTALNLAVALAESGIWRIRRGAGVYFRRYRGGIAYNKEEFEAICKSGLAASLTSQVLVEKSLLGWKEYELEVMRDLADNVVIICSIENIDPMGVHTGDSITVAPAQTLTDKEYQRLRDYSVKIIREIGVECGGSNVQFAVNPVDGEVMVIEMNPRVSRSSALASKATGFPIAKMAAKLSMKSVGESMALGRTFQESFQKAVRSLECGYSGWGCADIKELDWDWDRLKYSLRVPSPERIHAVYAAMKKGMKLKRGFSDKQIAFATKSSEEEVRKRRISLGVVPAYKRVDTCAAEFEANTPYMYSSYDFECESDPTGKKKVAGFETIMMNSNPETVSTDYDTSDRLYFEPLTVEDVLNVIDLEKPDGIIIQFGGQTPLKLALPIQHYLDKHRPLSASGGGHVRIWGTSPDSIDAAEDRERFNAILKELKIEQPKGGIAKSEDDALAIAKDIGYPVVVRPSYVLGGRAMEIVYNDEKLVTYLENAVEVDPERPVLIDKYLSDAIEIDVDALADSHGNVVIGGIMEHIEQAGVHSGDSACSIPTQTIASSCLDTIRSWTTKLAKRLNVCGLMNCQYAITASGDVFLLEANPRASRTVPFVSKAIGHPLAKYAALVMSGKSLNDLDFTEEVTPKHVSVKEAVLPFEKFQGCDVLLGPEMRSTGEVMGIDFEFAIAFAKAQIAAGQRLPLSGTVFLSLNDLTKPYLERIAKAFSGLGFHIVSTSGTAHFLELKGIPVERVLKLHEGRPHAGDMIANGQIQLMVITSSFDALDQIDGRELRRMALAYKVPIITTVDGALASAEAIKSLKSSTINMVALQDFFDTETEEGRSKNMMSTSSSL
ncbi:Carbamoyl-phosphate synthase large chain [Hibiscus syriacus]|uniref:Carbamoyl-phosphate synthase large chain n=1 Tax=Hibiscus syriacus TaxID=106335 RepID=A0A6A3AGS7_HIBSY|nr:Carbamoyl-phosphate synthase large chain [Hibiscus syriacus]